MGVQPAILGKFWGHGAASVIPGRPRHVLRKLCLYLSNSNSWEWELFRFQCRLHPAVFPHRPIADCIAPVDDFVLIVSIQSFEPRGCLGNLYRLGKRADEGRTTIKGR